MNDSQPKDDFPFRWLLWIMLLSLTIIFLAIVSSYLRYKNTIAEYQGFNHSFVVVRQLTELKSSLYQTESNGLAYMFNNDTTARPSFGTRYKASMDIWKNVDSLLADNPPQRRLCELLKSRIEQRYATQETSMKTQGNDSLTRLNADSSRRMLGQSVGLINQMLDVQYKLGDERAKVARSGIVLTPVFLLGASSVSFLCILFAYFILVKAFTRANVLRGQLAQNVKSLNQSNKELEQFAYIASHDLQEPLRKLRAFNGMLLTNEEQNLSEDGKNLLRRMEFSAARMHRLIEDLLTFSQMVNLPAKPAPVDLNVILGEVVQEIRENHKERNIIVQADLLPVLSGYSTQLTQLFQNIISNSVKYAKTSGDINIRIHATIVKGNSIEAALPSEWQGNFYQISISDNGIGFEQQYAQKIFNIFQRLHGRSEYEGTGIGLAICKKVVENHRGYIRAEGEPGIGTTIVILLPGK